jgi:ribosome-associated protein
MTDKKLSQCIVNALEDVKGIDIIALDVTAVTDVADQMILATGTSKRQVKALADRVLEKARELGYRPIGSEGQETAEWILVDFADIVVHVMLPDAREFYDLERLWSATARQRDSYSARSED